MGSYASFLISNKSIVDTKSDVWPVLISLFREYDKTIYKKKLSKQEQEEWILVYDSKPRYRTIYSYSSTVRNIKDRLNILGITQSYAMKTFNKAVKDGIKEISRDINDSEFPTILKNSYESKKRIFASASYDEHMEAILEFINNDSAVIKGHLEYCNIKEILIDNGILETYSHCDIMSLIRVMLDFFPNDSKVEYDVSDLVYGGYNKGSDPICQWHLDSLSGFPSDKNIIVLTEGSTDSLFIEQSLGLLYPHLIGFYSFMDFGISNAQGGASHLISTLKSFIGSGINYRIIALFEVAWFVKIKSRFL